MTVLKFEIGGGNGDTVFCTIGISQYIWLSNSDCCIEAYKTGLSYDQAFLLAERFEEIDTGEMSESDFWDNRSRDFMRRSVEDHFEWLRGIFAHKPRKQPEETKIMKTDWLELYAKHLDKIKGNLEDGWFATDECGLVYVYSNKPKPLKCMWAPQSGDSEAEKILRPWEAENQPDWKNSLVSIKEVREYVKRISKGFKINMKNESSISVRKGDDIYKSVTDYESHGFRRYINGYFEHPDNIKKSLEHAVETKETADTTEQISETNKGIEFEIERGVSGDFGLKLSKKNSDIINLLHREKSISDKLNKFIKGLSSNNLLASKYEFEYRDGIFNTTKVHLDGIFSMFSMSASGIKTIKESHEKTLSEYRESRRKRYIKPEPKVHDCVASLGVISDMKGFKN